MIKSPITQTARKVPDAKNETDFIMCAAMTAFRETTALR